MALMRFLGGLGLYIIGGFLILFGFISAIFSQTVCAILVVLGFIILATGAFYAKTSGRRVPQKIEIVDKKSKNNRYCPKCGREIPFDAKICPYCKKDFGE